MKKTITPATLAAAALAMAERGNKTVPCLRDCFSRTLRIR